jgi:hypothetical protein
MSYGIPTEASDIPREFAPTGTTTTATPHDHEVWLDVPCPLGMDKQIRSASVSMLATAMARQIRSAAALACAALVPTFHGDGGNIHACCAA